MKVNYDEYRNAVNNYYFDEYFFVKKISIKDKNKYKEIIDLYKKQNKYNIFRFLDERYFGDTKYGSKALFFSKSVFITLFLYFLVIIYLILGHYFNYQIYFPLIIIATVIFIISLILYQKYDFLFDDEKYKPKKTFKETRIAKMKNILK